MPIGSPIPNQTPMSTTTLHPLRATDSTAACAALFAQSEPWKTFAMDTAYFMDMLANPLNETHVVKVDEEIAGVVVVQMHGPFPGYIKSIVIGQKWTGRGLGRQLLEYAETRIFRDSPNVFLSVSSFNTGARAFYLRMGYQPIGELSDYLIRGASELLMRKTIGPVMHYHNQTGTNE